MTEPLRGGTGRKRHFHPPDGWDERDYILWSAIQQLPNYGVLPGNDWMVSLKAVIGIMERLAEHRFEKGKP